MNNRPPNPCQEPFTPCWCITRPNNPNCKDAVPIDGAVFMTISIVFVIIYGIYVILRADKPLTPQQKEDINAWNWFLKSFKDKWFFNFEGYKKETLKKDGSIKEKYKVYKESL